MSDVRNFNANFVSLIIKSKWIWGIWWRDYTGLFLSYFVIFIDIVVVVIVGVVFNIDSVVAVIVVVILFGPRNLKLKYGQNHVSNSWDMFFVVVVVLVGYDVFLIDLKHLSLKFSPNCVSNSWDIPDMYKYNQNKCCMDKYCLDKCHCDSWNLF